MDKIFSIQQIITHSGDYHVDEVFAIALLTYVFQENGLVMPDILRTRDDDILKKASKSNKIALIDVGRLYNPEMMNFDHHQKSFDVKWKSGTPLSSTGIIFNYLKERDLLPLDENVLQKFQKNYIEPIDAMDNGISRITFFDMIYAFMPLSRLDVDDAFFKSLDMMTQIMPELFERMKEEVVSEIESDKAYEKAKEINIEGKKYKVVITRHGSFASAYNIGNKYKDVDFYISDRFQQEGNCGVKTERDFSRYPVSDFSQKHSVPNGMIEEYENGETFGEVFDYMGGVKFIHKNGFYSVIEGDVHCALKYIEEVLKRLYFS